MAYNEQCGLVDAFGGIKDLENQMIRAVGTHAAMLSKYVRQQYSNDGGDSVPFPYNSQIQEASLS